MHYNNIAFGASLDPIVYPGQENLTKFTLLVYAVIFNYRSHRRKDFVRSDPGHCKSNEEKTAIAEAIWNPKTEAKNIKVQQTLKQKTLKFSSAHN